MRFDVLGRPIEARVTSVRSVNWRDVRNGGFMFVFRPGTFDQAPHGFIASMRGPADGDQRARLQRDLVTAFPNVSVIDLREVLETARSMIGTITLGVTVVGGLVLATGVLILTGAVAMTKFRRVYEAAILKTLGASTRTVGSLLLLEYGLLGLLAGLVGSLGGIALSYAISRWAIQVTWSMPWREVGAGVAGTTILVADRRPGREPRRASAQAAGDAAARIATVAAPWPKGPAGCYHHVLSSPPDRLAEE